MNAVAEVTYSSANFYGNLVSFKVEVVSSSIVQVGQVEVVTIKG